MSYLVTAGVCLAIGRAMPLIEPWLLAVWTDTIKPWLRTKLPWWLGGQAL